ncbi:MAG TPA: hypothetical protein VFS87_04515 [Qipengyuania sp.]|nr:hypothetical protein [Qipengyuania sp.]
MARSIRSRAPAPPGASNGHGTLTEAPLGGTRSEAMRRLQMGAVGVVAVLLLIGLASIIKDRATQTENNSVAEAAATTAPPAATVAPDPLAEAGVVPDMPTAAPSEAASSDAAGAVQPPARPVSSAPQDDR